MASFAKTTLIAAAAALTLGASLAATAPASARGLGGFFGVLNAAIDNSNSNSGNVYDAAGTPARGAKCHNEKQKLYDDDDNVVGSRIVQVCPVSQQ